MKQKIKHTIVETKDYFAGIFVGILLNIIAGVFIVPLGLIFYWTSIDTMYSNLGIVVSTLMITFSFGVLNYMNKEIWEPTIREKVIHEIK